jgi:hypothetical protein
MVSLGKLFAAILASLVLYGLVFSSLVHKPLTLADSLDMERTKLAYARSLPSPKLVLFAGSAARFSHSCERLTADLGLPCANMGVADGMALDYLLASLESVLKPGDAVYMPLEYDQYTRSRDDMRRSPETGELFHTDKRMLLSLGIDRFLYGLFSFDLKFLVSGPFEMAMQGQGVTKHSIFGIEQNEQGDETSNTPEAAAAFKDLITSIRVEVPDPAVYNRPSGARAVVAQFLDWAKAHGVAVIGGMPPTFDDVTIPPAIIGGLRALYETHGQAFLELPNHSQYPRSAFYDSAYHLTTPWQRRHSDLLAAALANTEPVMAALGRQAPDRAK